MTGAAARIERVRRWLRIALAAEAALVYAALLLAIVGLDWPDGGELALGCGAAALVIAVPFALVPLRRSLAGKRHTPSIVFGLTWLLQLFALMLPPLRDTGPFLLAVLALAQGNILPRTADDRFAAASIALGPLAVVAGFATVPAAAWLLLFPLSLVAAAVALLFLQARRAHRLAIERTPAALVPLAAVLGQEEEQRRALTRLALYAVPLTLLMLLAIPAIYIAVLVLPAPILHSGEAARAPLTEESDEPETPQQADARRAFENIFPSGVSFTGGVAQLQHATVMRVAPDPPVDLGPLYLRGMVLDTLTETGAEHSGGAGVAYDDVGPDGWATFDASGRSAQVHELSIVQQSLKIRRGDLGILFAPAHLLAIDLTPVIHDPDGLLIARHAGSEWIDFRARYQERRGSSLDIGRARAWHGDPRYRRLPRTGRRELGVIRSIATRISASADTDRERVERIVDHFRSEFEYSLTATEFPGLAGVVDFLRRKSGPCTYYAAASAIMLRSLDIPTRIATGFVAKDFDRERGEYLVTTREGHAWIEVHFEGVGWVTLDPTPADQRAAALAAALRAPAGSGLAAWTGELIYDLRRWARSGGDVRHMRDFAETLLAGPRAALESAKRAPFALVLLALAVGALLLRRRLRPSVPAGALGAVTRRPRAVESVYRKLLLALSRRGFDRRPAQTLREFFGGVQRDGGELYRPLPGIGELFYRARFGAEALTRSELGAIRTFVEDVGREQEEMEVS